MQKALVTLARGLVLRSLLFSVKDSALTKEWNISVNKWVRIAVNKEQGASGLRLYRLQSYCLAHLYLLPGGWASEFDGTFGGGFWECVDSIVRNNFKSIFFQRPTPTPLLFPPSPQVHFILYRVIAAQLRLLLVILHGRARRYQTGWFWWDSWKGRYS